MAKTRRKRRVVKSKVKVQAKQKQKKDKINITPLPALSWAGENNKELSKHQIKYIESMTGNDTTLDNPDEGVHYVSIEEVRKFSQYQKVANGIGFFVELHCARREKGVMCNGRIMTRVHRDKKNKFTKSGYVTEMYCSNCDTAWRFEKHKGFYEDE